MYGPPSSALLGGLIFTFQSACLYICSDLPVLPGNPRPSHSHQKIGACSEGGVQAADPVSLLLPCLFPLSRPTLSLVQPCSPPIWKLCAGRSYFGSSAPGKESAQTCRTHQKQGTPRRLEAFKSKQSVGFSVNKCSIPFYCH